MLCCIVVCCFEFGWVGLYLGVLCRVGLCCVGLCWVVSCCVVAWSVALWCVVVLMCCVV